MGTRSILAAASALWAAFALVTATIIYIGMLDHHHSYARLVLWQVLAWQPWALFAPVIVRLVRWRPLVPLSVRGVLTHAGLAVPFAVVHVAIYVALMIGLRPYDTRNPDVFWPVFTASLGKMHANVAVYLASVVVVQAVELFARFRAGEVEAARLESSLSEARLEALKLQLQPHFLFNTLHAIGGLVRQGRTDPALEMLTGLSDLLRRSLDEEAHEVPLRSELELVDRYLQIHRVRFSDRLSVTVQADEETLAAGVPPLILQPLVENAITHGIAVAPGPGTLAIRAVREAGRLRIEVENSGAGVDADGRRGVGLKNTEERLRRMYGADQRLVLEDTGSGARASIVIPFRVIAT